MKIEPKAGPAIPFLDKAPGAASQVAKDNRARAIAAFNGAAPQAAAPQPGANSIQPGTTVQNASNMSPEEMSGLKSSISTSEIVEERGQTDTNVEATSPPPAKVEEPLSPHFALLARKEKALRAEAQKLSAARAAFKAEQEALKATQASAPSAAIDESKFIPKERLNQDLVGVLEELGFSTEDIANKLLNRSQIDPAAASLISKLEAKLAKLEAAQDETKKTFVSAQEESYNQAITAMEYEAEDLVNNDPEFQTIKETGQYKEIVNLIKDVHEKGLPGKYRAGTLLSVEQAARLVEDELVNQWIEQHEKLSRLEKIQKRLKPATPSAKPGNTTQGTQAQTPPATQNTTRTLTNTMGSSGKMTARERAIAVFKGELK